MLKKILSNVLVICILLCNVYFASAEDAVQDGVLYDMLEKGTWTASNLSVIGTDSTIFPGRGEVIRTSTRKDVGVTLYDSFEEVIKAGKVKISFDFYADENYVGYPEFYFSIANMSPVDISKLWDSTPAFYPRADGTVDYYGGRGGSNGSIDWTVYETEATFEKGRWYTMESIVDFDDEGKVQGYFDGERLYEVKGSKQISGLIFVVAGKENSMGNLYFDNITVSEVQDNLSASFAYGEGNTVVIEFSQPVTAENVLDVKSTNIATGQETEILGVEQLSSTRIGYVMPEGLPYTEYRFIFGENNVSDFGASIIGSVKVDGTVGITDDSRVEIAVDEILMEDNFDSYTAMRFPTDTLTLDSAIWTRTGDNGSNVWWGMGPMVSADKKLQILNFHGNAGDVRGVKGKISGNAITSGRVILSFDLSYDDIDPADGNSIRIDAVSGASTFPLIDVKGESVSVYETQTKGDTPVVLEKITKENNDTAMTYEAVLDFDNGVISLTIADTEIPDITMSDAFKAAGITHIAFNGCKKAGINRQLACNCALIDNFSAKTVGYEFDYIPGVMGVRFIEEDGTQKTALDGISPLTEKIVVKFSESVNQAELMDITVENSEGSVTCEGNWNSSENTWELSIPEGELKVKTMHKLTVPATIYDSMGNTLADVYECTFNTGSNSRETNIRYINEFIAQNDVQGLAELLAEDPESIGIASVAFDAADKTEVAKLIIDYAQGEIIEDTDETVSDLQKLVLIECANNNRMSSLWDKDFTYGITDIRVFDLLKPRIIPKITEKVSRKGFETVSEFDSALVEAAVLTAIQYADGADSVVNLLTAFEEEIGGGDSLEITKKKGRAVFEKEEFDSFDDLKHFILKYKPESGSGSSGGSGGSGSSGGGFISSSTQSAMNAANDKVFVDEGGFVKEEALIFSDIADYPWAEEAITELFAAGVINGRGKNLFVPDANILREETAKIIVEAFKFYIKGDIDFDDVKEDDWFYPYIVRAYNSEVVLGISEKRFGSGQPIIRQDLAVMVYNAMNAAGVLPAEENETGTFADDTNISDYARNAVYTLKKAGIISGDENGKFNPAASASRAETAKIVYLATKYLK